MRVPMENEELIQLRFIVQRQYDGWRLDNYLKARIPRLTRNRIQKMLASQPGLGGLTWRPAQRVRASQEIMLLRHAPTEPDVPRYFHILYQDEHFAAISKPAGLPVHASATYYKNHLTALLRERFTDCEAPNIAHRLDRETSGIMLIGLRRDAGAALKKAFRERQVHKKYLAITVGNTPPEGVIELPLALDHSTGMRIKMGVNDEGLPSLTRYHTLEQRGGFSLVEVWPLTGRQHQIRAHFAAIGHSLVGDKLYGPDDTLLIEYIETGWTEQLASRLLLPRQALHAAQITFPHPQTKVSWTLECPLAPDLQEFWDSLPASP